MVGIIRLGGHQWEVKNATVGANILPLEEADFHWGPGTGGISWHLEIHADKRRIDGEFWSPFIYVQNFTVKLKTWWDLEGKNFFWPNSLETEDPFDRDRPSICLGSHDDILNARVRIGKRNQNVFELFFLGEYSFFEKNDQLEIETPIVFTGAIVWGPDEKAAWERLCNHLNGDCFSKKIKKWETSQYFDFEPLL